MVVHLPGDRDIVIDSKAVFDAFFEAASCTDEDVRKVHLQKHSQQVRARARELMARAYWNQFQRMPEFVIMFMPGEAFLYAAVEQDASLLEDCLKNKVILSTPTTLIALLKTIAFGWRQEEVAQNAEEIQKLGKDLYDRIATLGEHFANLGGAIEKTVTAYNKAVGTLETRVLVSARKMSELGARSDKEVATLESIDTRPRELPAALQ
jgi:DNA recombination protein RmuC